MAENWKNIAIEEVLKFTNATRKQAKEIVETGKQPEGVKIKSKMFKGVEMAESGNWGDTNRLRAFRQIYDKMTEQGKGMEDVLRSIADKGDTLAARQEGVGSDDYLNKAYRLWRETEYYPEIHKSTGGEDLTGSIGSEYNKWQEKYSEQVKSDLDLKVGKEITLGNYDKANEMLNEFKQENPNIDVSNYTKKLEDIKPPETPVVTQPETTQPTEEEILSKEQGLLLKKPPTSDLVGQQIEKLGATPGQLRSYRETLMARPELQKMAPEYRDFITSTLEQIDSDTRESIRQTEESAARGGLSPYAMRKIQETREAGMRTRRGTEAQLKLQDLETRMRDFNQKETERRAFIEGEYNTMRDFSLRTSEMFQRREWETDDQYKSRVERIQDELRARGYSLADIESARGFTRERDDVAYNRGITGEYRQREWGLSDELRQRKWALEDYERQKADYMEMLEKSKPKEQPWWQPAVGAVATGVGYAVGGPVGGYIGSQIAGGGSGRQSQPSYGYYPIQSQNPLGSYPYTGSKLNVPNYQYGYMG